jgi:hypothetical protein
MDLYHLLFDGSLRPRWAGPVTVVSRNRNIPPGKEMHSVELSGVIVPVHVHRKYVHGIAGIQHTFGLSLGFPDLRDHFLPLAQHSRISKGWEGLEDAITAAALRTMKWEKRPSTTSLNYAGLPPNALHLRLVGQRLRYRNNQARGEIAEPDVLAGELIKTFPIRDVSGTRLRMQTVGSPASFKLTPSIANWSRDPRSL